MEKLLEYWRKQSRSLFFTRPTKFFIENFYEAKFFEGNFKLKTFIIIKFTTKTVRNPNQSLIQQRLDLQKFLQNTVPNIIILYLYKIYANN